MIVGVQHMRKLQLVKCEWKDNKICAPLLGYHPAGPIFWGLKVDERSSPDVCAVHSVPQQNCGEQISISEGQCQLYVKTSEYLADVPSRALEVRQKESLKSGRYFFINPTEN